MCIDGTQALYTEYKKDTYHQQIDDIQITLLQASTLQAAAEAVGLAAQSKDPDRDVVVPSGPASLGKPTWLVASPLFGSSEGRVVESSIVVLKQLLDMQAMTVRQFLSFHSCSGIQMYCTNLRGGS